MKKTLDNIDALTEAVEYKTQIIGRNQRLINGVRTTRLKGIIVGIVLTFIIIVLPVLYFKGGF